MTDQEILDQSEEVEVQEIDDKKPAMVFEDEFEIIDENDVGEKPEVDLDAIIAAKIAALQPTTTTVPPSNDELSEVLKNLNKTLQPKAEAAPTMDWEKFYAEQADELSSDPAKAVKNIVEKISQQVGSALQYQGGQIIESQKETSKLLAKADPGLKVVFDNWSSEIDDEVKNIKVQPGQSAVSIYNQAARVVKMNHIDDLLELKLAEFKASQNPGSVKVTKSKVGSTTTASPVEGQEQKARYSMTKEQKEWCSRQINPDLAQKKLLREGKLRRVN